MSTYVVSDLHGYYDVFLRGLSEISFSDEDFLWCLGDAIDRGPDGIKILQHIHHSKNMDLLIGNHEFLLLNSVSPSGEPICNGGDSDLWLELNGGRITFSQYKQLLQKERKSLLDWLKNRYVLRTMTINGRSYCLTHSFYNPKYENKKYCEMQYRDIWSITWSSIWRDDFFTHAPDVYSNYDYTFVCGHVPVQRITGNSTHANSAQLKGFHHDNLINIDGGCAIGRVAGFDNGLIILKLDDMSERYVPLSG